MMLILSQGPKGPPGEAGPDGPQGPEVLYTHYSSLLIDSLFFNV